MPMASANPPSVMMLMVCFVIHSANTAPISERGMLMTTIKALRQSRKNKSTIKPVSRAPKAPSKVSPAMAPVT